MLGLTETMAETFGIMLCLKRRTNKPSNITAVAHTGSTHMALMRHACKASTTVSERLPAGSCTSHRKPGQIRKESGVASSLPALDKLYNPCQHGEGTISDDYNDDEDNNDDGDNGDYNDDDDGGDIT